jgi:hypothetical protein
MILATIPMAFILSGAAAGAGAGAQGLSMLFALVVSIGAIVYAAVVAGLVSIIDEIDKQLAAYELDERKRAQNKRNFNPYV